MLRSAEAFQQLAKQLCDAVGWRLALAVLLRGAHHKSTRDRKGSVSAFYEHASTSNVIENLGLSPSWFHAVRKDFRFSGALLISIRMEAS
jgi:hypothetical protein